MKDQTRVMLDLSRETKFAVSRLKEDPVKHTPARIYIDIPGAKLALASKDTLSIDDGVLRQVRVGQYSADVVRVVEYVTPAGIERYAEAAAALAAPAERSTPSVVGSEARPACTGW